MVYPFGVTALFVSTVATLSRQPDGTWLASSVAPPLLVSSPDRDDAERRLRALAVEYVRAMQTLSAAEREEWLADLRSKGAHCLDVPDAAEVVPIILTLGA